METESSHENIVALLAENRRLVEENNTLLKKMHRRATISLWITIVWYVFLIGVPFALYFYILEPYFTALGSNFEIFQQGMQEIPGLKQFNDVLQR